MASVSISFVLIFVIFTASYAANSYRAAVYEHRLVYNVPLSQIIEANLVAYDQNAEEAASQDAKIIVFPEDGIIGLDHSRTSIRPLLEQMPDPKTTTWSPCDEPKKYGVSRILYRLSCMAKKNKIYVVANMGELLPCNRSTDPNCPQDGNYQFNTDVVFDSKGVLLAKYHKCNLYFEFQFDTPVTCQPETFETDFAGTFGLFTCFDILFHSPAVDLVHQGVKNFAFPTAWMDVLPLMSAVQTQMGWSTGYDVNLLAANLHIPEYRFHGSGIYSGRRASPVFYYSETINASRLIVADVPLPSEEGQQIPRVKTAVPSVGNGAGLNAKINGDIYNAVVLHPTQNNAEVCYDTLCCQASYQMSDAQETYVLGAFSGVHKENMTFFMQVCTIVKCSNSSFSMCNGVLEASTKFSYLDLSGNFTTKDVYPSVVLDGVNLAGFSEWQFFDDPKIKSSTGFSQPLLAATLLGRWFERDRR